MKRATQNETINKYFQSKDWTKDDIYEELAYLIQEYIKSCMESTHLSGVEAKRLDFIPMSCSIGNYLIGVDFPTIGIELVNEIRSEYKINEFIRFLYDYRVINRDEYKTLEKRFNKIVGRTNEIIAKFREKYPDEKKIGKKQRYFYDALNYYNKKYGIPIMEFEAIYNTMNK